MAKKKFKFDYKIFLDSPVPVFFVIISILVFLVDFFFLKDKTSVFLTSSPTAPGGSLPFLISQPLSYLRLFLYVFGFSSPHLLVTDLIFIMLLGPAIEERYGSVVIGIMMAVSALFAGVLNACFCKTSLRGASCIIFMLIFLNSFMSLSKKKIPLSFIFVVILYIVREFFEKSAGAGGTGGVSGAEGLSGGAAGLVSILICIAGGLCGSLFAFLTSPKARAAKKAEAKSEGEPRSGREAFLEELDSQSPRFQKKNRRKGEDSDSDEGDDDSTVVGTLKF
ncbi:MAG: rhomboid family intramembrane serine protease [Treponema sp.]|nr:rhomboid family intramembrane serine protease [Treponema sp.]